jgi:hypothetical protein
LHRYLYAGGNPTTMVDPGGREFDIGISLSISGVLADVPLSFAQMYPMQQPTAGQTPGGRPETPAARAFIAEWKVGQSYAGLSADTRIMFRGDDAADQAKYFGKVNDAQSQRFWAVVDAVTQVARLPIAYPTEDGLYCTHEEALACVKLSDTAPIIHVPVSFYDLYLQKPSVAKNRFYTFINVATHEITHMTKFASPPVVPVVPDGAHPRCTGALDSQCYGIDNVKRLARLSPGTAVENADSYAFFLSAIYKH